MVGLCKSCKHTIYCTYRPDGTARFCDEFEDAADAPERDWDLQEFLRLYAPPETQPKNDE